MDRELENVGSQNETMAFHQYLEDGKRESGERNLLLQAFEIFTQASSSLESAFSQLQERAQRLTEELEAKNLELERSLREKEEVQNYLKTILERLPCGVFVLDPEGSLTLCNPMASEVLSESSNEFACGEETAQSFLSAEMRNHLTESVSNGYAKEDVEISIGSNHKKRILSTSGTALKDAFGNSIGTLHIIRDVTEVKALQEQNKRVERLSAMGEMAVELAHEIRNPLGSIELFASLLVQELAGDPRRWAENIRIGTRSLNTIVSNMLHFSNPLSPAFCRGNPQVCGSNFAAERSAAYHGIEDGKSVHSCRSGTDQANAVEPDIQCNESHAHPRVTDDQHPLRGYPGISALLWIGIADPGYRHRHSARKPGPNIRSIFYNAQKGDRSRSLGCARDSGKALGVYQREKSR
jgi:PAS domain S-box-containing protein